MHKATFERLIPTEQQAADIARMRESFAMIVAEVTDHVPESADRTYVIRQLRTCAMWCNMAITHNDDGSPRQE